MVKLRVLVVLALLLSLQGCINYGSSAEVDLLSGLTDIDDSSVQHEKLVEAEELNDGANTLELNHYTKFVNPEMIQEYFRLQKKDIISMLGNDYLLVYAGAEGTYQGYRYDKYGLVFTFEENESVAFIFGTEGFEMHGVHTGMDFMQIQERLGEAVIQNTWVETPDNIAYMIIYIIENCRYQFLSFSADGSDSQLSISRL
jgi:hypothetical protein